MSQFWNSFDTLKEDDDGFRTNPQPTSDLNPFTSYINLYFRPGVTPGLIGVTEIEKTIVLYPEEKKS